MNKHGVDVGRINYQDNGNWTEFKPSGSSLHLHLYGRARSAKIQKYGQSLFFPHEDEQPEFYKTLQPLNQEDIQEINSKIIDLLSQDKYTDFKWGLAWKAV